MTSITMQWIIVNCLHVLLSIFVVVGCLICQKVQFSLNTSNIFLGGTPNQLWGEVFSLPILDAV